jgi:hypothetical protein
MERSAGIENRLFTPEPLLQHYWRFLRAISQSALVVAIVVKYTGGHAGDDKPVVNTPPARCQSVGRLTGQVHPAYIFCRLLFGTPNLL